MNPTENWKETPGSSQILGFGYAPATRVLTVQFKGGAVYDYSDVPALIWTGMSASKSTGSYFAQIVKPAGFKYAKRA